jgi:hypothetical protein
MELSTYPRWKILKLDEFTGHFSELWGWLDNLQIPPVDNYDKPQEEIGYSKQLEDHNGQLTTRDMMKDALKGLVAILGNEIPDKKKQIDGYNRTLQEKYPMHKW